MLGNIEIIKTPAIHGTAKPCGDACGFVFRNPDEKTLYICGDTIWCASVEATIAKYNPDVIVTNNCAAKFQDYGRFIMDGNDLLKVYEDCPDATIIASHMDNVAHATLTRATLREKLTQKHIADKILIPDDGDVYYL